MSVDAPPVPVEKEADEQHQGNLQQALTEHLPQAEGKLARRINALGGQLAHLGLAVGELAHVGVDVAPDQRNLLEPGRRAAIGLLDEHTDIIDEVDHRVGQRGGQTDHRHQQHGGQQQGHGDRGQTVAPAQAAVQRLVHRPGGDAHRAGKQDRGKEGAEHEGAAKNQQSRDGHLGSTSRSHGKVP